MRFRLAFFALSLPLACSGALAQSNIVSLIASAPTANAPSSASDLFLVIENGMVKQATGAALKTSLTNLTTAPAATLPLGSGDTMVVVQGGLTKRIAESAVFNWSTISVVDLRVSGTLTSTGPIIASGGLAAPDGVDITGSGGLVVSGSGGISAPGFSVDFLGNTTAQTMTLTPTLRPRNPAGGRFVFYVDAFDNSLYVQGWLGTVKKVASP